MEGQSSVRTAEVTALFQIYDSAGIGEISKHVMLSNFASICYVFQ